MARQGGRLRLSRNCRLRIAPIGTSGYASPETAAPAVVGSLLLNALARQRSKKNQASSARFVTPGRVGIMLLFLAALWVGSGFVNKMVVAYKLDAEARQLRQDNQRLADANRGYQSQLTALSQPGGKEEQERLHNYVQKDEKVYVIAQPSPGPSPSPRSSSSATGGGAQTSAAGFFQDLWGAVTSAFH